MDSEFSVFVFAIAAFTSAYYAHEDDSMILLVLAIVFAVIAGAILITSMIISYKKQALRSPVDRS